ncbi:MULTISPECIES: cation:proton antiporter [Rhizobium]|uniref:cation:proton antiporter n=1 Tax=Rhizobium TaxID=379 RepID=UPI0007EB7EC6|nr:MULTISPECIES: cation:proton antiporter [Rhizobium]ANK86988.1 cation/H+ antiporter protein [Rhizobium sp. N731]ANK92943.1 cation/H+ antiporter protein [Rhizobium sp. N6212]ANK98989.1 cation/H+ antiporter protein [Rhizobium sp. N621]ANL05117.1 cation/H+ antiporter protein [Rhizobium esperanzae]ANL11174.1 cation/H+ antiporter protein [Rhizobium sp. N1341]
MAFFESMLTLLLVAIIFLQFSRKFRVPYPTMLAIAGIIVAAFPWAPEVAIDPRLALALFIAPVLFDAAYDLPPRTLRRNWLPLFSLAAIAVILTAAAVAAVGVAMAGLPLAVAVALGAIVAPPDAVAATVMLDRFNLPRQTYVILKGESLLNDAVALLIFSAAVAAATNPAFFTGILAELTLAAPGGLILGYLLGRLYMIVGLKLAGTLGGTLLEFVATFGTWIIAERLHLSAILAIVAYAMVIARYMPERQTARHRIHSYSVWEAAVFLLNVLAFLLMGLQVRQIVLDLDPARLNFAFTLATAVFVTVIAVRLAWVLVYNRVITFLAERGLTTQAAPTFAASLLAGWCGMRGLVTLATALALPIDFHDRDIILLSALAVVLGTLIVQGLTLGPLIRFLKFDPDTSLNRDLTKARVALIDAALAELEGEDKSTRILRDVYTSEREIAADGRHPREVSRLDKQRRNVIGAKRRKLAAMRRAGEIDDDVFHMLEQELDWAELAVLPPGRDEIVES